jgi:integration host factor subunit alpha
VQSILSLTAVYRASQRRSLANHSETGDSKPHLPVGDILLQSVSGMIGKTVTRAELCEAVYRKVGLSRRESETLIELVLKEITDCLARGESVKLSAFGSFVVRKKGQRIGRNPQTGKEVVISPRRVMVFKASAILKQRINGATGAAR